MLSAEQMEKKSDRVIDPFFRVEVLSQTQNPQQVIYAAAHQDYSENFVWDEQFARVGKYPAFEHDDEVLSKWPDEEDCGDRIVKHLLSGNRGHYGPLEHPQIVFNCGWFPHSVMQQLRTHRVGISMDVQSGRYTGQRIIEVAEGRRDVEEVFYLRPIGTYSDRQSKRYEYGSDHREWHKTKCIRAAQDYHIDIKSGLSEEHARDLIPFGIRQHWVLSLNLRSLMHILLIRGKRDAQLECQQLCELMLPHFQAWCPQVYEWFEKNLWLKGRLAP